VPKEQIQLTTLQANESRFVTKCRWVVEGINGFLKKFKSLKEVENNSLKHIIYDYKIAAAFVNQFFKQLYSDGDESNQLLIAKSMKDRLNMPNKLEKEVAKLKLNTKSSNEYIKLDAININDFPRLSIESIKHNITLGSYQLDQSISYIVEHLKENGNYEIYLRKINKSTSDEYNIIQALIRSRHSNQKKYSTFVKYLPNGLEVSSISGWFCSCKNGRRTIGCCSHVACLIFYLSYGKERDFLKKPSFFSSILVPQVHDDDEDDEDAEDFLNSLKKNRKKTFVSQNSNDIVLSSNISTNTLTQIQSSIKHSLSFDEDNNVKKIKHQINNEFESLLLNHIPSWGGRITHGEHKDFKIINTCTIDYFLLGIWFASKLKSDIINQLNQMSTEYDIIKSILEVISSIELNDWNRAKSIWILDVLHLKPTRRTFSTFGEEFIYFIKYFKDIQNVKYLCIKNKEKCVMSNDEFYYYFDENQNVNISLFDTITCPECKSICSLKLEFEKIPPWLFVGTLYKDKDSEITFNEILPSFKINEKEYKFLFYTININNDHFKSVFKIHNDFFLVDDLNSIKLEKTIPNHKISSCFYYLS
jgi:hypothetical protein